MPKPILFVEDSQFDQDLARTALEQANLLSETEFVNDGDDALDYLFRRGKYAERPLTNPSLVILDLKLPRISGIEILHALRANVGTSHIPVVVLTSSTNEDDIVRGYELGVNAFVKKPARFEDLIETIESIGRFWMHFNQPPFGSNRYIEPIKDH